MEYRARYLILMLLPGLLWLLPGLVNGQDRMSIDHSASFYVMRPTGEILDGLPVMYVLPDSTAEHRRVQELVDSSFVGNAVRSWQYANQFLKHREADHRIEPAYLALTRNEGGFARKGFYLQAGDRMVDKKDVPYIDLVENRIFQDPGRLMSISQLFPHEMGHAILHLLNPGMEEYSSKSVDMHYFSVSTDFNTAFDEGFAEHIENLSRFYEPNPDTKSRTFGHAAQLRDKTTAAIRGFDLDLRWPVRMGFYKMTMLLWYQQYENLKRFDHAVKGTAKYSGAYPDGLSTEEKMIYRNAALFPDSTRNINYSRALATEGVISTFFTALSTGEAGNHYLDQAFYNAFTGPDSSGFAPADRFQPWENQLFKYYSVFYSAMRDTSTTGCALLDFIEGYRIAFPADEPMVREAFFHATGQEYRPYVLPPLWLMVRDLPHRYIVPDPYGTMLVPVYTFDLHAAEALDLQTIPGVDGAMADSILAWRDSSALDFRGEWSGNAVPENIERVLRTAAFDQEYFDRVSLPELRFQKLILTPALHLLARLLLVFLIFYVLFRWASSGFTGAVISKGISIGLFVQWMIFGWAGLFFVIASIQAWVPMLILIGLFLFLDVLIYRKDRQQVYLAMSGTLVMGCLLLPSLV